MCVQTRPAGPGDLDVLYKLICELAEFEGKDPSNIPVTKENLQKYGFGQTPYFQVELAENQNMVVGYALYSYVYSGHQGAPVLYVDDLYVKPSERNQNIGTLLFKKLAKYALEQGCCRMEWLVYNWNSRALSFYENLGGTLRKDLLLMRMGKDACNQLAK